MPDLIDDLGIAALNADTACEVWTAARDEHMSARAQIGILSWQALQVLQIHEAAR